ncbi:MAG TPA: hypothetical protein VGG06_13415 [Thermoanaerobaculia bacterium]|jgi:hypothetical protein
MRAFILPTLLAAVLAAAPARADVEIHADQQRYVVEDARKIKVDLSFGHLQVEGTDARDVEVEFRLTCSRQDLEKCRRRGERIRVVPRVKGENFVVRLEHTPRGRIQGIRAELKLKVPKDLPLDVDMAGGDVFVTRMLSDVVIAGGAGSIDVIARHERVGAVNVKVVAGKAELWMGDGHMKGGGFPRSIRWQGPGASRIEIDWGTGDARIRLE